MPNNTQNPPSDVRDDPWRVAHVQRKPERFHVVGIARQDGVRHRQEMVFLEAGVGQVARHQVFRILAQSIAELQKAGVWVVGVEDDERAQEFDQADLDLPLALVIGAEGPGLARLTRERCDFLIKLPMRGQIASLNAAVAGSIVLYPAWRLRRSS